MSCTGLRALYGGGYPLGGCLWLATRGTPHELYWLDRYLWLTTRGTPNEVYWLEGLVWGGTPLKGACGWQRGVPLWVVMVI